MVCVFPIWTYGAVACYQLQLVLPSFWHLSWPVGSTPITHRERRQRQLSQKRQHCIHYIASCSLDDGLHRKKTPAWLSVYISLAGRRTAGSQQRPLAAVDVSEAAVGASINFRGRTSKQANKQNKGEKMLLLLLLMQSSMLLKKYNMVRP